jgi:uncharacterized membrane protein
MDYTAYYVPALALLACAALYLVENRARGKKWIYGAALTAVHIFVIIYFLFAALGMDILLLFLLASLALAVSVGRPKG